MMKFTQFSKLAIIYFLSSYCLIFSQETEKISELKTKLFSTKEEKEIYLIHRSLANEYLNHNLDSAIVYGKKTIPYLQKTNNYKELQKTHFVLAYSLIEFTPNTDGIYHLKETERYNNLLNDQTRSSAINYLYGLYYLQRKDFSNSFLYLEKNIKLNFANKLMSDEEKDIIYKSYYSLYANFVAQNNYKEAYKYLISFVEFSKKNLPLLYPKSYQILGEFYLRTNEHNKALKVFKDLEIMYSKNTNLKNSAIIYKKIGEAYKNMGLNDSAKAQLNKALSYYESLKSHNDAAEIKSILATIFLEENNFLRAKEYIENARDLLPNDKQILLNHTIYRAKNVLKNTPSLIRNESKINEVKEIIYDLNKNFSTLENTQWLIEGKDLITKYTLLSNLYEKIGDNEQALFYFKKSIIEKENYYGLEKLKELSYLQAENELANERERVKLEEEKKRLELKKEIELKALKFEYEKKQAEAKTEAEKKRLLLEEDLKRREIELTYAQQKKEAEQKYIQEKKLAKINQEKKDAIAKAELENSKSEKNMWAIGAGLSLLLLGFAGFSYNQKRKDNKKIAEEKQKSENLLLNILPHEVAEELKEKGKTNAKHFDEVSVLFTDFVNFTANSERIGVQEVVNELNICFTEFDKIMDKYNLEKIKTIGDAYLAVSGLPVSNEHHAENAVNAGLEILDYIQKRKENNPNALDIRIGIHSGPVIAGIVGVKKFAYDIWGDTVNTAARMEQNSQKGKLNISGFTYDLIKNKFICEYRGKIEVKGKGELDMYFVEKI